MAKPSAMLLDRRRRRREVWDPAYTPVVTVVIATYDEAAVIAKTIASLRRSAYPHLEVLVVDDGSTDGTADVARAVDWDRLRVVRQANGGESSALNRALAEVRSEIVVTFDADTVVTPDTVGALVRHFADPRVGAVAGQVKVGNRRGLLTRWQSLEYLTAIGLDRTAQSLLGAIMVVPGACAAWRRTVVPLPRAEPAPGPAPAPRRSTGSTVALTGRAGRGSPRWSRPAPRRG